MRESAPRAAALALRALLVVAMLLGLTACARDTPQESPIASSAPTPRPGGSLTVAYLVAPATLDPAAAETPTERMIVHAVYEGLLGYESKPGVDGVQLQACLAADVPTRENGGISSDGLIYTLTLREGLRFQPPVHRELEAADVKYSLERMLRLASEETRSRWTQVAGSGAFFSGRAGQLTGITIVNSRTLEIRLTRPDPLLLHALAQTEASIVAREWIEKWRGEFGLHPLGTGPFVLLKWDAENDIRLARNPEYWRPSTPYVDAVNYIPVSTPAEGVSLLRSGAVDILSYALSGDPAVSTASPSAPAWEGTTASRSLRSGTYLFLNTKKPPLNDVRVRRAIGMAIGRDRLAALQPGRAAALALYYPPDVAQQVTAEGAFGHDPEQARELLRQAGHARGLSVDFALVSGRYDQAVIQSIRADLNAIGVRTNLTVVSARRYNRLSRKPVGLAMGLVTVQAPLPDPGSWMQALLAGTEGSAASSWRSATLAARRARADAIADPVARMAAYADLQTTLALAAPYIPLYSSTESASCSPQVGGFYLHPVYGLDVAGYWTM